MHSSFHNQLHHYKWMNYIILNKSFHFHITVEKEKAHLVNLPVTGKQHICICLTCKILVVSYDGDYVIFVGNLVQYFTVFIHAIYACVHPPTYASDHLPTPSRSPSQKLKPLLLFVLFTVDSANNSVCRSLISCYVSGWSFVKWTSSLLWVISPQQQKQLKEVILDFEWLFCLLKVIMVTKSVLIFSFPLFCCCYYV